MITESKPSQTTILAIINLLGLLMLTLHIAAPFLPEETAWSLWPYIFLPTWLGWGLALLVGALTIPAVSEGVHRLVSRHPVTSSNQQLIFMGLALLAGGLFYLARLRHLRWGDAYWLTVLLSYPELEHRVIYNWQAPLTVLLHQRLWQFVAEPLWGWPVEQVYATVSLICGVGFVYVLLNFSHQWGRDRLEKGILTGLMLTTGSMQLFFGYVENYTIMSLGLLITLYWAWQLLRGSRQLFWPILAFSLTNAFHPSTVFLWPGMLLLAWLSYRRGRVSLIDGLLQTVITPLLIGGGVGAIMEIGGHGVEALTGVDRPGGGDGIWFVPLFEVDPTNQWQRYTLFSPAHLIDWFNLHLLLSPLGLLIIVVIGLVYRERLFEGWQSVDRDYGCFLMTMAGLYVLLTFVWNPDYGARHDWDLFAPSAFVYTLLVGHLLSRALTDRALLRQAGLLIIGVSGLHTVAWIVTNTHYFPHN